MAVNWQDVATTVGSTAVIVSALAFLTKSIFNHVLTRDVERFKARLKSDADIEVERLKNSLQMVALEHQVRFSKLHEKRAELMADLHARLVDAERTAERFVYVDGWDDEKRRQAYGETHGNLIDLYYFVEKNRLYFPERVCDLLTTFVADVRRSVIGMHVYAPAESSINQAHNDMRVKVVTDVFEAFQSKIPAARKALEAEFRTILGG